VTLELILLERLLTLPRLGVHEHLGPDDARERPGGESGENRDRPTTLHAVLLVVVRWSRVGGGGTRIIGRAE
jgi:hypothetical protein